MLTSYCRALNAPRIFAGLLLLFALCCAPARVSAAPPDASLKQVEFFGPNEGFGAMPERFHISAKLSFSRPVTGQIVAASINGETVFDAAKRSSDSLIDTLSAKKAHLAGGKVTGAASSVYVQFYTGWQHDVSYTLGVTFRTEDGKTLAAQSSPAIAPAGGAIAAYPNFFVITVKERGGLARQGWPVTAGVPIRCGEVADPYASLYLVRYDPGFKNEPIPFHVFDVVQPEFGPEIEAQSGKSGGRGKEWPHLFQVGFPADLPANGTGTYLLYYSAQKSVPARAIGPASLTYRGENPGVTLDTGDVTFGLNPKTGSLMTFAADFSRKRQLYSFKQDGRQLDIHYNPDVWAPPLSWGHTCDWDLGNPGPYTPSLDISRSSYAYRSFRKGLMPRSNETKVDFTYTFYAGVPFFYADSRMEFTLNTLVNAVRNSELVFSRGQMTHGVWADEKGRPQEARLYDPDNVPRVYHKVAEVSPDTQFVGMFSELDGAGICLVNLGRYAQSYSPAADPLNYKSEYYVSDLGLWLDSDHPSWAFTYMTRPEVYYNTVIPKGTVFEERNAVLVFRVGEGKQRFDDLLHWVKRLRTPPAVTIAPAPEP